MPRLTFPGKWCGSPPGCWPPSGGGAGTPRGSRALSRFWQAVLGLRRFRDRTAPEALARDHGISRATAYRYLEEVTAVLAGQAPCAAWANAGSRCSPAADAPSSTSPPASKISDIARAALVLTHFEYGYTN